VLLILFLRKGGFFKGIFEGGLLQYILLKRCFWNNAESNGTEE